MSANRLFRQPALGGIDMGVHDARAPNALDTGAGPQGPCPVDNFLPATGYGTANGVSQGVGRSTDTATD